MSIGARPVGIAGAWLMLVMHAPALAGQASVPFRCVDGTEQIATNACLDLRQTPATAPHHALLRQQVVASLEVVRQRLPLPPLTVVIVDQPGAIIPEIGLGGYTPSASQVRLFVDPRREGFAEIIRHELLPLLAHELHHAARWRAVGYGFTLRDAAVSEGLADHFAHEVSGREPPPWSRAFDSAAMNRWLPEVTRQSRGFYNHSAWFFGQGDSIPRWTGYAVGYELVRRYLAADTSRRAAALAGVSGAVIAPAP